MNSITNLSKIGLFFITLIIISCAGEDGMDGKDGEIGPQGANGLDGNANVQSYELTVSKDDWGVNTHHGGNNEYRRYFMPEESVGGINVSTFYKEGNAILAYASVSYAPSSGYTNEPKVKQLPYISMVSHGSEQFGLWIELAPTFNGFLLAKTLNGYEPDRIPDEDVPETIDFRVIFIEVTNASNGRITNEGVLEQLQSVGIDVDDYQAVMDYFGLQR